MDMQFSRQVENIQEALSIYINQLVYDEKRAGKDITVLSLGEAFFDIPMFDFSKLDFTKGYHYCDSQGLPELRSIVSSYYNEKYGADISPDSNLIITAGSKLAIYSAIQAIINFKDEVIIHEPAWLSYKEQISLVGGVTKFIPYHVEVKDFHKYFSAKTRMLIINNPNNPSGRIYSAEELESLYVQCLKKGIYVLVDEAYSDFVLNNDFQTMASISKDLSNIIVVNSLSKNMGMSGWRIGYTITNNNLIKRLLKLNQHLITCAPTILQHYIVRYFKDIISVTLPQIEDVVRKRQRIEKFLDAVGLECMRGEATFYFLINLHNFPGSSLDFALELLTKHQVAVVPGIAYGNSCSRFIRMGIGAESEERIHDAILVIKDLIYSKSRVALNERLEVV